MKRSLTLRRLLFAGIVFLIAVSFPSRMEAGVPSARTSAFPPQELIQYAKNGYSWGAGTLTVEPLAGNAVRIRYTEEALGEALPEWVYVDNNPKFSIFNYKLNFSFEVDTVNRVLRVRNREGKVVFSATEHQLRKHVVEGRNTYEARLAFASPDDEALFGLGQFQDGYANVRGLTRRLTQVNTQISVPMLLSSKGYGILWNNYGLVDFNPAEQSITLEAGSGSSGEERVNVTSTEGGRWETRRRGVYEGVLDIHETGDYALMLDVGQAMARRHQLTIDGKVIVDVRNLWLPPTTSVIVSLTEGTHEISAELSDGDRPVLYYRKVTDETVFRSPVSEGVDYTLFVGTPDEIISSYRSLTGEAPLPPRWALGYIHCRERFHSQDEILSTARQFREKEMPVGLLVQDWQYWGKYGWNAMQFDEDFYPDPKQLTDSLHAMDMRLMLSVWSKIDKRSDVGRMMEQEEHYIPGTDWIDFFSFEAAQAYWEQFSKRLVPLGIDAWWQDATEPENDDLAGRLVNGGRWSGNQVRNAYPLMVNKTVYEGLRKDLPGSRPLILTRCGFPGIQRYGAALWSGDVGNDWETLRRQIVAGLGLQAAGIPWWTYDAGGFFRPNNQYSDPAYIERMLRWIETSVYLPLMRVHGYMSNTEPWNYGPEAEAVIARCIRERCALIPYIYSQAAAVNSDGSTLMRPLVFDFPSDSRALQSSINYMFGSSLLVSPVIEPGVTSWITYLPETEGGWYDYHSGKHYEGGDSVTIPVTPDAIPVFARAGSIVVLAPDGTPSTSCPEKLNIHIYPRADATFVLYEDDGTSSLYRLGAHSRITFHWDDARQRLTIERRKGSFEGMLRRRQFTVVVEGSQPRTVRYTGSRCRLKFPQDKK